MEDTSIVKRIFITNKKVIWQIIKTDVTDQMLILVRKIFVSNLQKRQEKQNHHILSDIGSRFIYI